MGFVFFIIYFITKRRKLLPRTSKEWNCERSRASVFIQTEQIADKTPDLVLFRVDSLSQKSFCERIKRIDKRSSLNPWRGTPTSTSRNADSLDRKRFIGEHRGELKRRDGRGKARRTAQTGEQKTTHLAAWLSAGERNPCLLSGLCLNAYQHSLFSAGYFACFIFFFFLLFREVWFHIIWLFLNC